MSVLSKKPEPASWGRYPRVIQTTVGLDAVGRRPQDTRAATNSILVRGGGLSYGDVCLNHGASVADARTRNTITAFDPLTGRLVADAGVTLGAILDHVVPSGWFLPVTPGTSFATLGGAIGNDVHGKNHHRLGSFGCHVRGFELETSDGARRWCTQDDNDDLFRASIGGLGLTGFIRRAEIALRRITSSDIDQLITPFRGISEALAMLEARDATHEYVVAWLDTTGVAGRQPGLCLAGNHGNAANTTSSSPRRRLSVPIVPPFAAVNRATLKAFNTAYFALNARKNGVRRVPFAAFFYPLDAIGYWNRLYGPRGLLQHQCVVPRSDAAATLERMLEVCRAAGHASFLTVLKLFGAVRSPGLLSFARPGVTLTLDFPNRGQATFHLLDQLDSLVMAAGGAINPAKDARMSPATFDASFPNWRELARLKDTNFSSSFWRRVTGEPA